MNLLLIFDNINSKLYKINQIFFFFFWLFLRPVASFVSAAVFNALIKHVAQTQLREDYFW